MEFARTLITQTIKEFIDDRCTTMAPAITYYVLISIFPLLVFLAYIFSFFVGFEQAKTIVTEQTMELISFGSSEGDEVKKTIQGVIDGFLKTMSLFAPFVLLWSGSRVFAILRTSINDAWDVEQRRPIVRQKLIDLAMVFLFGLLIGFSVLGTVAISILGNIGINFGWLAASLVLPGALSFLTFTFLFKILPNAKVLWKDAVFGGLFTAILFEVTKNIYVVIVSSIANDDATYGTASAFVGFLIWVHISCLILLLGAELTSEIPRVRRGDYKDSGQKVSLSREFITKKAKGLFVSQKPEEE